MCSIFVLPGEHLFPDKTPKVYSIKYLELLVCIQLLQRPQFMIFKKLSCMQTTDLYHTINSIYTIRNTIINNTQYLVGKNEIRL